MDPISRPKMLIVDDGQKNLLALQKTRTST